MPSLRARLVFLYLRLFWIKSVTQKGIVRSQKNNQSQFEKFLISKQAATTVSKEIEGVHVDIVEPQKKRSHKVVIYVHGGGFVYERTAGHAELINRLAVQAGVMIYAIHYKLAPEFTFPTQIQEVEKVYLWLLKHGYTAEEIYFAGDSAGGNIALATIIALRDKKKPLPNGIIVISAPVDGTFTYPSFTTNIPSDFILTPEKMRYFIDCYRGKEPATNPLISPIFANLKGLPKVQLFVSDNELPYDDVINFSRKLQEANVTCELHIGKKLMHGYPLVARFVPEAIESICLMAKFINKR